MNNEQYNFLLKYKEHMRLAYESGYSRNISKRDRAKMKDIVEQLTKAKFNKNIFCNSCIIEMLCIIKKYFDKYEEKLAKKNQQQLEANADNVPEPENSSESQNY